MRLALLLPLLACPLLAQSNDLFVLMGSDVSQAWQAKANYAVGYGRTLTALGGNPVGQLGQELTFSYSYEDAGSGFFHSAYGAHTGQVGLMRNFRATKTVGTYSTVALGLTALTGGPHLVTEPGYSYGVGISWHLTKNSSIWFQGVSNKLLNVPVYVTFSVGIVGSW